MPGLNLGVGANVRTTYVNPGGSTPKPTTATEAAFGPAAAPSPGVSSLTPTTPGGLAFWAGVGGALFLVAIYYSLPG